MSDQIKITVNEEDNYVTVENKFWEFIIYPDGAYEVIPNERLEKIEETLEISRVMEEEPIDFAISMNYGEGGEA